MAYDFSMRNGVYFVYVKSIKPWRVDFFLPGVYRVKMLDEGLVSLQRVTEVELKGRYFWRKLGKPRKFKYLRAETKINEFSQMWVEKP